MTDEEMWFRFFDTISKTNTYPDPLTVAQSASYCLEEYRRKFSHPIPNPEVQSPVVGDDYKWFVKARVYGAIARKFHEALARIQMSDGNDASNVAKAALDWRHGNGGGVPWEALKEFEELMKTIGQRGSEDAESRIVPPSPPADAPIEPGTRKGRSLGQIAYEDYYPDSPWCKEDLSTQGDYESLAQAVRAEVLRPLGRDDLRRLAQVTRDRAAVSFTDERFAEGIVEMVDELRAKR